MLKSAQEYQAALRKMQDFLDSQKAPKVRSKEAKRFDYLIDAIEEYEKTHELEDASVV